MTALSHDRRWLVQPAMSLVGADGLGITTR
jgi:hypothetical protein